MVMVRLGRRGSFGPNASAALRSVYPIVLGLGGWSLGLLVTLATMPGVSLDNGLVAVVSAGVPMGLGIYGACYAVSSGRSRRFEGGRRDLLATTSGALHPSGVLSVTRRWLLHGRQ